MDLKETLKQLNLAQLEVARINARLLVAMHMSGDSEWAKAIHAVGNAQRMFDTALNETHGLIHKLEPMILSDLPDPDDNESYTTVMKWYQSVENCLTGKSPHVIVTIPTPKILGLN